MTLTPISVDIDAYPAEFRRILSGAQIYDSSCSPEAKVVYIDRDCGYFLKSAAKGVLLRENAMTQYFNEKGLSAKVIEYISREQDWLLTEKIPGNDCVAAKYLERPERLCDTIAELLVALHEMDFDKCPVPNHIEKYAAMARRYAVSAADHSAIDTAERIFDADTLLHGDYCLPNIILKDWNFSGFIDLDQSGVGDRHVDIFWGAWTLQYNLKTDKYRQRFLDAYGRQKIDLERLEIVYSIERIIGL
ncbi:MAG: aminoglycoside 3'-phosphotransferase [Clostridiales bacterium]|jgi:kanamycin kinase|nr:aminoglycoside 3'-phosphotransferase [Clostridiales bacterium]